MEHIEIVVVASHKRKALILPYLTDLPYKIYWDVEPELPEGFAPADNMIGIVRNQLGAYRCFRGHQEALRMSTADYVLLLEDDAIPDISDWFKEIQQAIPLLEKYSVVSFHGRQHDPILFGEVKDWPKYIEPNTRLPIWMVGTLAYMMKKEFIPDFLKNEYYGKPWDLLLYQHRSFCCLKESIFIHDRSQGSLID